MTVAVPCGDLFDATGLHLTGFGRKLKLPFMVTEVPLPGGSHEADDDWDTLCES